MGENAKKSWDWHNTIVGEGYQAKGVVRQRVHVVAAPKIVDMSLDVAKDHQTTDKKKKKKVKRYSRQRSHSESDDSSGSETSSLKRTRFNPVLQCMTMRLRDNIVSKQK